MMDEDAREEAHKAALAMLDSFARVSATRFDLTLTNGNGEKVRFRSKVLRDDLRRTLPGLLDEANRQQQNIIVRPHSSATAFVQLDDLNGDKLDRVLAFAFLALETSPGSFQAWIALPAQNAAEDFARRLRKGTGADPTASGATRIAGSRNFKPKHAPNFPPVVIAHDNPGLIVTREQLEAAGLAAAPEPPARRSAFSPQASRRRMPDYQRCVDGAPLNHAQTAPDLSKADFMFGIIAHSWGFSTEEITARLMEVSAKAQENGEKYARMTAENAADAERKNRER